MFGNSAPVTSNQAEVHPDLDKIVRIHLEQPWRAPPHGPSRTACLHWLDQVSLAGRPFVLDSGCGTGDSTRRLAAIHPEAIVLGVDQSEARLGPGAERGLRIADNAWLLRARAEDTWRVLLEHGCRAERHYLLYPNPWPKSAQLKRRWHGHPAFPTLLAVSRTLELRTNWPIYAQEFAAALAIAGWHAELDGAVVPDEALSPFESKYLASGHRLWRVVVGD